MMKERQVENKYSLELKCLWLQARQELEKIRRKLEAELAEVSRQLEEAKQQVMHP